MVCFTCNGCGNTMKKNQVDLHTSRCTKCSSISCLDCGKEYWGSEYAQHTKCITEDAKYGGKNYVPKVNANELKQEQWTKKIEKIIETCRKNNPRLSLILNRLKDCSNVPRKKEKFATFAKTNLNIENDSLIDEVWEVFNNTQNDEKSTEGLIKDSNNFDEHEQNKDGQNVKKKSKKKKNKFKNMENDSLIGHSKEEKNEEKTHSLEQENGTHSAKKHKKKKNSSKDFIESNNSINDIEETETPSVKKKKKKNRNEKDLENSNIGKGEEHKDITFEAPLELNNTEEQGNGFEETGSHSIKKKKRKHKNKCETFENNITKEEPHKDVSIENNNGDNSKSQKDDSEVITHSSKKKKKNKDKTDDTLENNVCTNLEEHKITEKEIEPHSSKKKKHKKSHEESFQVNNIISNGNAEKVTEIQSSKKKKKHKNTSNEILGTEEQFEEKGSKRHLQNNTKSSTKRLKESC